MSELGAIPVCGATLARCASLVVCLVELRSQREQHARLAPILCGPAPAPAGSARALRARAFVDASARAEGTLLGHIYDLAHELAHDDERATAEVHVLIAAMLPDA